MPSFDERLVLNNKNKENIIYNEHLARYELAGRFATGKKVLDIACGSGYGAKILARTATEVIAVDIDEAAIKQANEENQLTNLQYKIGNAEQITAENESFDLVVSFETIEHLKNPEKYLQELSRVVKKNGLVMISTPNKEVFKAKNIYHHREYTREEFASLLKKYFSHLTILEQKNGLASFISGQGAKATAGFTDKTEALYFIALCSKDPEALANLDMQPVVSVNSQALTKLMNHPGLKIVDGLYSLLIKIPGLKSLIKK